jgi:hypothetical protein
MKRTIRALFAGAALLLPAGGIGVASPAASPQGLDRIVAYKGTWKSTIVHYETKYDKAHSETATVRNDCWRSAGYFACDQFVNGPSKALVVYTYDPARRTYTTYDVPTDGRPASSGTLTIAGNTWIYPWQTKDGGKTTYFRVVNVFRSPATIAYKSQFSADNVHWTTSAEGMERRVAP